MNSPLPWKLTNNGLELRIDDANGFPVFLGNVNGGIEFADPKAPELLERAIALLNQSEDKAGKDEA
jgi:hypothetical protein